MSVPSSTNTETGILTTSSWADNGDNGATEVTSLLSHVSSENENAFQQEAQVFETESNRTVLDIINDAVQSMLNKGVFGVIGAVIVLVILIQAVRVGLSGELPKVITL